MDIRSAQCQITVEHHSTTIANQKVVLNDCTINQVLGVQQWQVLTGSCLRTRTLTWHTGPRCCWSGCDRNTIACRETHNIRINDEHSLIPEAVAVAIIKPGANIPTSDNAAKVPGLVLQANVQFIKIIGTRWNIRKGTWIDDRFIWPPSVYIPNRRQDTQGAGNCQVVGSRFTERMRQ